MNETHYVGDGRNTEYLRGFATVPAGFVDRLEAVLYPGGSDPQHLARQYRDLLSMIDDVEGILREENL